MARADTKKSQLILYVWVLQEIYPAVKTNRVHSVTVVQCAAANTPEGETREILLSLAMIENT